MDLDRRRLIRWVYSLRPVRNLAFGLYVRLPPNASRLAYRFARRFVVSDPREPQFKMVFERVAAEVVDGDYLEFGVMWGRSLVMAARHAQRLGLTGMRFIGFDSFKGLPSAEGGIFATGDYRSPQATAERYIRAAGVDTSRVRLVAGWFKDTLTPETVARLRITRVAVAHIDCDIYESARDVLSFIEPYLTDGSVLLFDDWGAFDRLEPNNPSACGEKRALDEWRYRDRCTHIGSHGEAAAFVYMSQPQG